MSEQQSLLDLIQPEPSDEAAAPEPAPVEGADWSTLTEEKEEEKSPTEELHEDVLNVIEPLAEPAPVALILNGKTMVYLQRPLSYFGKMEFMGLLGKTIDSAMKEGLTVSTIFGVADAAPSVSDLTSEDFRDLESFLSLVSKIAGYAPDFLRECYLIWLGVPKSQRAWAREALDNLDDTEGLEIIERFIDQNWDAVEAFLTEHLPRVMKRVTERRKSA